MASVQNEPAAVQTWDSYIYLAIEDGETGFKIESQTGTLTILVW